MASTAARDLLKAVDVLTFSHEGRAPKAWRRRYEDALAGHLSNLARNDEAAASVREAAELLPEARRRAFLRAPLVASRLLGWRDGEPFHPDAIVMGLMAELTAAGIACDLDQPAWTALGDRRVDPAGSINEGANIPHTSIVVDRAGPVDFSVGALRPLVHPEPDEWRRLEHGFADAATKIAAASPAALAFWQDCVDVVAVRSFRQPGVSITSAALRYNARVTLLVNGHVAAEDSAVLADTLLHEAIHSFLFMWEEANVAFVPDRAVRESIGLVSPWSGHPLKISALIHACLVWYGLHGFWSRAGEAAVWPADVCTRFRRKAAHGFSARPLDQLRPHADKLSPEILVTLKAIEAHMQTEGS